MDEGEGVMAGLTEQAMRLCLPRRLFLEALSGFWAKLEDEGFWDSWRAQEIAIEALGQDYLRVDHKEHLSKDAVALAAAIEEYGRRRSYMDKGRMV